MITVAIGSFIAGLWIGWVARTSHNDGDDYKPDAF